ncbi:MAG TPA: hypothetical protein DCQ51_00620, partial [Planktothrix sp. UBA8407]|nr:hypothetical protein [Planktothrix sp. UBA8407]
NQGQLCLDHPLEINKNSRVEVIVLIEEESEDNETPDGQILADFRQSWQEAMTGKTIPVSQLWEDI